LDKVFFLAHLSRCTSLRTIHLLVARVTQLEDLLSYLLVGRPGDQSFKQMAELASFIVSNRDHCDYIAIASPITDHRRNGARSVFWRHGKSQGRPANSVLKGWQSSHYAGARSSKSEWRNSSFCRGERQIAYRTQTTLVAYHDH